MKALNLVLHCGGKGVTRDELANVVTPQATDTWTPIPHELLLGKISETLTRQGLSVVSEAHGLAREGQQYFGMLQVVGGDGASLGDSVEGADYGLVVGIRNSHDKSFPAALALGAGVFVCDNLSFSGEVKLARKHTRFINRDLSGLVNRAVGMLGSHRQGQAMRITAYKGFSLGDVQVHDALINALDAGVIGACQLPKVLQEWREPSHEEFRPRTAWSLFNGFTHVLSGNASLALPRTQKLHGLMDSICGCRMLQDARSDTNAVGLAV